MADKTAARSVELNESMSPKQSPKRSRLSTAERSQEKQSESFNSKSRTPSHRSPVRKRVRPPADMSSLSSRSSDEDSEASGKTERSISPACNEQSPKKMTQGRFRRNSVMLGTLYHFLKYHSDAPNFDLVVQHAVRLIDIILESRKRRRAGRPSNAKEIWLGERLTLALNQPDEFGSLRSARSRWLLALRQLTLQRRLDEAARLMERMLLRGQVFSTSLLWRFGFHVLSRVGEGRSEESRQRRMKQVRAGRLDAFMKQLCRSERSIIDFENLILEYVLHCLADEDLQRAVQVMQFVSKDTAPSQSSLRFEVEASRVYHLRQCYLGLAHAGIWSLRMEEARRTNASDGDHVLFEAEKAANRSQSYFQLSLSSLIGLGEVIDVFLEAFVRIAEATGTEQEVERLLRSYARKAVSPNAPRFLAQWLESQQDLDELPDLMLATVKAAPNDWSLVSDFLKRFPDHSECPALLFNFLDHPAAALRCCEAWTALRDLLRRQGDQGHWDPRRRLWNRVYFQPEVLRANPHLKKAARLLQSSDEAAAGNIDSEERSEDVSKEVERLKAEKRKRKRKRQLSALIQEEEGGAKRPNKSGGDALRGGEFSS